MRIPVFARRLNPAIDRPILRKSLSYAKEQVACGVADWVDPEDLSKGIIAREMLTSGKTLQFVETVPVTSFVTRLRRVPSPSELEIAARSNVLRVRNLHYSPIELAV